MAGRKKGSTSVTPEDRRIARQISMSNREWQELDQDAENLGLSRSAFIRMVLDFYRQQNPNTRSLHLSKQQG